MPRETTEILLIEDDPTLAEVTRFRLELLDFKVRCAATVDEAMTALASELPDVIILDLALPGADGIELANRLSNDPRTSQVPIMAFSTDADLTKVQRAYTAGIKEYLVTPYDPIVLETRLERLTKENPGARAATNPAALRH